MFVWKQETHILLDAINKSAMEETASKLSWDRTCCFLLPRIETKPT